MPTLVILPRQTLARRVLRYLRRTVVPSRWQAPATALTPPLPVLGFRGDLDGWLGSALPHADLTAVPISMATCFSSDRLTSLGLSTRSPVYLDALAYRATDGYLAFDGLVSLALGAEPEQPHPAVAVSAIQLDALVGVTQVAAALGHDDATIDALLTLAVGAAQSRPQADRLALISVLIARQQRATALSLVAASQRRSRGWELAMADLLNPHVIGGSTGRGEAQWLATVNAIFTASGLEPVSLDSVKEASPLDRLRSVAAPVPATRTDPLVTVIMSCFEPGPELLAAVRSVIAQSWQHWELLIMDDASPAEYDQMLSAAEALDARVTVVRSAVNAGTYVRRNDGLVLARGRYVTMHDSDDWAHPRRLELQVRHLQASPSAVANVVQSLRVTDELEFTQPRGARLHLAEPSLMFEREVVMGRIGFFDAVRRAADTEFRLRLESAFGVSLTVVADGTPLFLMRYRRDSLSGHDLSDGWTHPGRPAYRSAHLHWRESVSPAELRLPHPLEQRPFPAPAHLLGEEREPAELDVLVVLDGRRGAITHRSATAIAREWRAAAAGGLRVGVMHAPSPHHHWMPPELHATLQRCISDGTVQQILIGDRATTRLLVVRHASAALGLPAVATAPVRAHHAIIVRDASVRIDAEGHTFSRAWCDRQLLSYASVTPSWRDITANGLDLTAMLVDVSAPSVESAAD